jgi:hypothetical protein
MESLKNSEEIRIHPRPVPAFIILGAGLILLFVSLIENQQRSAWFAGIGIVAVSFLIWLVFSRTMIILDQDGLKYRNILGSKEVSWNSITNTYIKYHHRGKASRYFWHFDTAGEGHQKFSIRFFSRKDLKLIAENIIDHCRGAVIEDRIHDMAQGRFPWRIIF